METAVALLIVITIVLAWQMRKHETVLKWIISNVHIVPGKDATQDLLTMCRIMGVDVPEKEGEDI